MMGMGPEEIQHCHSYPSRFAFNLEFPNVSLQLHSNTTIIATLTTSLDHGELPAESGALPTARLRYGTRASR